MLHTFMTSCSCLPIAVISLIAFSHRTFEHKTIVTQNISRENIRQYFFFSVAVLDCSHSSYLLGFIDMFA